MRELTDRQQQILEAVEDFQLQFGYPPTVRDLCTKVGLSSTCSVFKHLRTLEKKGFINRDGGLSRSLQLTHPRKSLNSRNVALIPLLGQVAAGRPLLADENIQEYLPLARSLVADREVFLLRVNGDSMIGDGISHNDIILVRRQSAAEPGDVVVALVQDEATVKRFWPENGKVKLVPSNEKFEPLIVDQAEILGKVVLCIHRL